MQDKVANFSDSKVNVTIHQSSFSTDGSKKVSYAKVQRETAYIGNIIDKALEDNPNLKRATLLFAADLLRDGILALLKSGKAVDILELGTLYIKPDGSINKDNPSIEDVPPMTLGFTPSQKALDAVKDVSVAADISKKNLPEISEIFNVKARAVSDSLNAGYSIKIHGAKLKIAGEEDKVGLFFAPCDEQGRYDEEDMSGYLHVKESELIANMATELECNVPEEKGRYRLIIATAYRSKNENSKTIRFGLYEKVVVIN